MIRASTQADAHRNSMNDMLPDLTPMMDVFFMLLVFFLLTANSVEHALKLDLPREGADQATPIENDNTLVLTLKTDMPYWQIGAQSFHDWPAAESAMRDAHRHRPDAQIVIAGERSVPMERMMQALAMLKREGMSAAQILMEPEAGYQKDTPGENPNPNP